MIITSSPAFGFDHTSMVPWWAFQKASSRSGTSCGFCCGMDKSRTTAIYPLGRALSGFFPHSPRNPAHSLSTFTFPFHSYDGQAMKILAPLPSPLPRVPPRRVRDRRPEANRAGARRHERRDQERAAGRLFSSAAAFIKRITKFWGYVRSPGQPWRQREARDPE